MTLAATGHYPHLSAPLETRAALRAFLTAAEATAAAQGAPRLRGWLTRQFIRGNPSAPAGP